MQGPMTTDGDISVLVSARRVRRGPRCRRPFGSDQKATARSTGFTFGTLSAYIPPPVPCPLVDTFHIHAPPQFARHLNGPHMQVEGSLALCTVRQHSFLRRCRLAQRCIREADSRPRVVRGSRSF